MNSRWKRGFALALSVLMLASMGSALAEGKPDTWIADRVIQVQAYVDDIGYSLPDDQLNTPVMQELAARTGMKIEFLYTPGENDRYVMAAQLATGNLPDMIISYLNNSTRPEFPILHQAAMDGMFTDLAPYLADTKIYSKYMDITYLPADAYHNITWREDFNGAAYMMQLAIPAVDDSMIWNPNEDFLGGMYIRRDIAEDLALDTKTINSSEELYELLKTIKEKEYKDVNGNTITPLGPKYWGGSVDALQFLMNDLTWGVSGDYNITDEGKVLHEAETDWVYTKINYLRKLLAEDLMHPEYFTMDTTRADELCENQSVGIISDVHNYVEIIYRDDTWIPLGPVADYKGSIAQVTNGKGGYGQWAIPASTENPEEIVKLMDYLSTYEGQLLVFYGVEGLSYNMVDGFPVLTEEASAAMANGDTATLRNKYGAAFNGSGVYGLNYLVTDVQMEAYFGEARPGAGSSETFARAVQLAAEYPREFVFVSGLNANAYLAELEEVNAAMNLLNYDEMLVQAAFADSDEKVKEIVEAFRAQLKQAGIEEFEALVEAKYAENPDTINFR